jgi:NADP-dependent 3-hydroxy acid dehydrogenase YdfG
MPTALITGASGGLGSAIATALAPTHTLFLGGRPSERLDELAERLGATTWPLDLEDVESIPAAVEPLVELDVLIHNAGAAYPAELADSTVDEWRRTFEVNVVGAVALTQALMPVLRASKAQVVFVNSGAGLKVLPGMASYSASKFAQRAVADSLREAEPSLRVTSVHPGRIDTAMQQRLVEFEGGDYNPAAYLRPETVAKVIADVVLAPRDAHVHEVIVRPH